MRTTVAPHNKAHSIHCLVNTQCMLVAIIIFVLIIVGLEAQKDLIDDITMNRFLTVSCFMTGTG